jgi:hypothetical protein
LILITDQLTSGEPLKNLRVPIFDNLTDTKKGVVSSSEREDRYMIVRDIENVTDPNPSKWVVHKYFQTVFWQIWEFSLVRIKIYFISG